MPNVPDTHVPVLFRNGSADGQPRAVVRRRGWTSPTFGVHVPPGYSLALVDQCRAIGPALPPGAVFTHVTGALLRRWWLPRCLMAAPIIACSDRAAPHHDRRGVYLRRCGIPAAHRVMLDGVAVASAEWTIIELAEVLGLIDLVTVMESAVFLGDTTLADIAGAMVPGRRGVRALRRALPLVDGRAESPWEVYLRLVHVLSGITDVEPQQMIYDADGVFVARVDLRLGRTMTFPEYDGADHRRKERHQKDLRREKAILRIKGRRMGYTAVELHAQPGLIVRDAEDALGLPRDRGRVRGWLHEYESSALSDVGEKALNGRMQRFLRDVSPHRVRADSRFIPNSRRVA